MTTGAGALDRLEQILVAIERIAAEGGWNELAGLEPELAATLEGLRPDGPQPLRADRQRLQALLARIEALSGSLAARHGQIKPLLDAFVPFDSDTTA